MAERYTGPATRADTSRAAGHNYDVGYIEPGMRNAGGGGQFAWPVAAQQGQQALQARFNSMFGKGGGQAPAAPVAPAVTPAAAPALSQTQTPNPILAAGQAAIAGPAQTVAGTGGASLTPAMQQILATMIPQGYSGAISPLFNRGG